MIKIQDLDELKKIVDDIIEIDASEKEIGLRAEENILNLFETTKITKEIWIKNFVNDMKTWHYWLAMAEDDELYELCAKVIQCIQIEKEGYIDLWALKWISQAPIEEMEKSIQTFAKTIKERK